MAALKTIRGLALMPLYDWPEYHGDTDALWDRIRAAGRDEGLDLPMVDAVVLAAPSSHKAATRQRVGRACRALEGKRTPVVVDVVDDGDWALRKWSARKSLYRSLGWPIRRWR